MLYAWEGGGGGDGERGVGASAGVPWETGGCMARVERMVAHDGWTKS